jgi:hypothetical protein
MGISGSLKAIRNVGKVTLPRAVPPNSHPQGSRQSVIILQGSVPKSHSLSLSVVAAVDLFVPGQFNVPSSSAAAYTPAHTQMPCSIQLFLSLSVAMEMATRYIDTLEL